MDLKYKWYKYKEDTKLKIAGIIPRWLVYWASIRLMAHATTGPWANEEVPAMKMVDALQRWHVTDTNKESNRE